jgi:serine protease Do
MVTQSSGPHRHSHLTLILLSALVGAALATVYFARPNAPDERLIAPASAQQLAAVGFEDVAEKVLPAVVYINSDIVPKVDRRQQELQRQLEELFRQMPGRRGMTLPEEDAAPKARPAAGSGWIYSPDGHIVTNAHVVRGASKITVKLHDRDGDTKEYPAKIVGIDPRSELAVIKVEADRKLPVLPLGDSDKARTASWVMAVGSPFMLQQSVTVGVLSARGRVIDAAESDYFRLGNLIQTDAPINPGNSGGPLVNLKGEVIGINVAIASPGASMVPVNIGIGFAIPSNVAKLVVPQLVDKGQVARGWLGVTIKELNDNLREHFGVPAGGVLITEIHPEAPAAKQLQPNDVVLTVNGEKVNTTWDLSNAVANTAPGTKVKLEIVRGKRTQSMEVELGKMPAKYAGLEEDKPEQATTAKLGLDITVRNITPEMARNNEVSRPSGVAILAVGRDLAPRLRKGDVIVQVGDTAVADVKQYEAAVKAAVDAKRKFVVLTIERLGEDGNRVRDVVDVPLK